MADLLAKQENKKLKLNLGQELEGEVVGIFPQEVILDLNTKAEGVLPKRDLPSPDEIKIGDKIPVFVFVLENDSHQIVLGYGKAKGIISGPKGKINTKWFRFQTLLETGQSVKGKAVESNKGGLVVEIDTLRGFLPASQMNLAHVASLEDMVGKFIDVTVLEANHQQNRLILAQKLDVPEDIKNKLLSIQPGEEVDAKVTGLLPFGVLVDVMTINDREEPIRLDGFIHISELSWDKVENPSDLYKAGDALQAKVVSSDINLGRVNLSVKQTTEDPFSAKIKDLKADDVVKGEVVKIGPNGVSVMLDGGIEGLVPVSLMGIETEYTPGGKVTLIVDSIDTGKHKITLAPFVTSTKDLIYK